MTNLSPAAQAVLDAANYVYDRAGTTGHGLAAALRAAASQLTSAKSSNKLRAIADELEAQRD
jgi:hypothetical protein